MWAQVDFWTTEKTLTFADNWPQNESLTNPKMMMVQILMYSSKVDQLVIISRSEEFH